jgi:hypothetical protein
VPTPLDFEPAHPQVTCPLAKEARMRVEAGLYCIAARSMRCRQRMGPGESGLRPHPLVRCSEIPSTQAKEARMRVEAGAVNRNRRKCYVAGGPWPQDGRVRGHPLESSPHGISLAVIPAPPGAHRAGQIVLGRLAREADVVLLGLDPKPH